MSLVSIFGDAPLDTSAGYATDPDLNPITVATRFYVTALDGASCAGVRIYPGTGGALNLAGCWAYLQSSGSATVLAAKQFPDLAAGWNELLFDTPVALTAEAWYYVAVYMPNGGFSYKSQVFGTTPVQSTEDPKLYATNDANGGFQEGTKATPATPTLPAPGSWQTFNATHYGVDVIVDDPTLDEPTTSSNYDCFITWENDRVPSQMKLTLGSAGDTASIPIGDDETPVDLTPYSAYTEFRALAAVTGAQPGDALTMSVINSATGATAASDTGTPGVGRTAPDSSASSRTIKVNGGVTVASGAYLFDGTTGFLSGAGIPLTTAFTFEVRLKRSTAAAVTGTEQILNNDNISFWLDPTWGVLSQVFDGSGSPHYMSTLGGELGGTAIEDTSEHHIEFAWDGTTCRMFVDGVLRDEDPLASIRTTTSGFTVGAITNSQFLNASVKNVAVHNVARHTATFTPAATPTNNANTLLYLPATTFGFNDPVGRLVTGWTSKSGIDYVTLQVDNTTAARGVIDSARVEVR